MIQEEQRQVKNKQISVRLEANLAILDYLKEYFTTYPDMRFGQGLYNIGIATHLLCQDSERKTHYKDIFFTESTQTLRQIMPLSIYPNQSMSQNIPTQEDNNLEL